MKIYSVESGRKIRKGITVKKKGDFVKFISFDKGSNKVYLSIFYPDIIFSEVVLPPVSDNETLLFLLQNRLSGLLEENKSYSFALFEKEKISESEISYDVYAISEEAFFNALEESNFSVDSISLFTIDVFSLIPFSHREKPGKTVLHFYGDDEKILIVVSKDDRPIYVRAVPIPEFMEKNKLPDIYYENFNMTYLFVYQNKRIEVEDILISGKASYVREFLSLVENLTGKVAVILKKENYVSGLSEEDFHDYLIPIGTVFLEEKFNFIPLEIKKKRTFNFVLNILTLTFIFVATILFAINFSLFVELKKEVVYLNRLSLQINQESREIGQLISKREIDFYSKVFKNIEESKKSNPLSFFYELRDIFFALNEKNIQFNSKNYTMTVTSEESFNSFPEMIMFKNKISEMIKKKKAFDINLQIKENQQDLKLIITMRIQRKEGAE